MMFNKKSLLNIITLYFSGFELIPTSMTDIPNYEEISTDYIWAYHKLDGYVYKVYKIGKTRENLYHNVITEDNHIKIMSDKTYRLPSSEFLELHF